MNKKMSLALAIASILSTAVTNAVADAVILKEGVDGGPAVATYATELPDAGGAYGFSNTIELLPPDRTRINNESTFVNIFLTGGAKFTSTATSLKLTCTYSGAAKTAIPALGGANADFVSFRLATGRIIATTAAERCIVTGITGLTLNNTTDQRVSAEFQYYDTLNQVKTIKYQGSLITFARGLDSHFSASPLTDTIEVGDLGRSFVTNGTTPRLTAPLGYVSFGKQSENKGLNKANTGVVVASAVESFAVTVKGSIIGAVVGKASTTVGVYLVSAAKDCAANSAVVGGGTLVGSSAILGQITFPAVAANLVAGSGLKVCVTVDGLTPMEKGQITATLTAKPTNNHKPTATNTNNNLVKLLKNGTSKKVLVLPKPEALTSGGDVVKVRLYNTSAKPGKVLGTLYYSDDAGNNLSKSGTLVTQLAAKQVVVMTQKDIADALAPPLLPGKTDPTWVGRAWLQIDAEFTGLEVQALMRAPNGQNIDMSAGVCQESVTPGIDAISCSNPADNGAP